MMIYRPSSCSSRPSRSCGWKALTPRTDGRPDDLLTHVDVARALTYKQPVGANADLGKRPERPPMSDRGADYRLDQEGADDDLQAELVQVAAVAIAWLESLAGDTIGGPERAGL